MGSLVRITAWLALFLAAWQPRVAVAGPGPAPVAVAAAAPMALVSVRRPPRKPGPGKPPLLVLLHGFGASEHDLMDLADRFDPRFAIRSARAPRPKGPGFAWFDLHFQPDGERRLDPAQVEAARRQLARFVQQAVAADGADPQRVYLAGFSQGGIMALALALTRPQDVAGAVVMSGRLLPETVAGRAADAALRGLPLLLVHGTADRVIPVAQARAALRDLERLPVAATYRELPMGHTISPDSAAAVAAWLTARLDARRR